MRIITGGPGVVLVFEDGDDYECHSDNEVSVFLSHEQLDEIFYKSGKGTLY